MVINPNITRLEVIASKDGNPLGSIKAFLFNDGSGVSEALATLSDSADMNTLLLENESLEAFVRDGFVIPGKNFLSLESVLVVTMKYGTPDFALLKYLAKTFNVGVMSYVPQGENDIVETRLRTFGFEDFGETGILVFDPQKIDYQELRASYGG